MHRYDVAFVFDSLGYERFVPFEIADLTVVSEARAKSGGEYYYLSVRSVCVVDGACRPATPASRIC